MSDISIIVPIYNAEKYINKCLDSLINQTKKELEFILVNDGSTDNTEKIIKKYNDNRIKYYKNKNQGIGKTRNFGIEKSTGKYIMFLDSDDYLEKEACELLYNNIEKNKTDLVLCDFYKVYDQNIEKINLPSFEPTSLKNYEELLLNINLSPWNKLYKRSLIVNNKIEFNEILKYEDATFVVEALNKAKKISKENNCLINYVIHNNSETTVRDKRIFDILKVIDIIRKYLVKNNYDQVIINKLVVRIITNYTIQQRNQKDIKVGIKFIEESFDYLEKYVPDYKKNIYYENRGILRRTIEKNKGLSKLYCRIYNKLKNKKK